MHRIPATRLVLPILLLLVAGCGAKTGLEVPDTGAIPDGGQDGGPDAGPPELPCIELPPEGGLVEVPLDIEAQLARADVLFLVDTTASMGDEIREIRTRLRDSIAPGIRQAIPDSALGVASFADFPVGECGEEGDAPFRMVTPITTELDRVQAAVDSFELTNGLDRAESQVEALYQTATGEGIGSYVPPSFGCPGGGNGYPCFRSDALPVVLLFTDAAWHNGPGGVNSYSSAACSISPAPHTYPQALSALDALSIRVMGLYSGNGRGLGEINSVATDTGAVQDGRPLVFDIGEDGRLLSDSVITAIRTLADVIEFDVDTFLVDPNPGDEIDPRDFVESVVPVRAEPMDRIRGIDVDSGQFLGVRAGTRVFFRLLLRNDMPRPPRTIRVMLEIVFRGDGRTRLGSSTIELVIPGLDGGGCDNN